MRPGAHRGDGRVLADRTRHEDEWQAGVLLPDDLERVQSAEPRHRVIGNHNIPSLPGERLLQSRRGFHALVDRIVSTLPQLADQQERIVLRVLDDQDMDQVAH